MAWSWVPVARRYSEDERLLSLPVLDRLVFREILCGVDEHGRFDAGETALRRLAGLFDGPQLQPIVVGLAKLGLVYLYEVEERLFGVVDHFDAEAPRDVLRGRPTPSRPSPPPCVWEKARCSGEHRNGRDEPRTDAVPHAVLLDAEKIEEAAVLAQHRARQQSA